jgi:subtilisin family serine protease
MKVSVAAVLAFAAGSVSALAPVHTGVKTIPSQYIVVLKKDVDVDDHLRMVKSEMKQISPVSEILHKYEIGEFKGFAVRCSEDVLQFIRSNEDAVEFVEEDQFVSVFGSQSNPPSWGLDRIDQKALPLNSQYKYPDAAGSGVNMYTVDTGIRITHKDFGNRAKWGYTANPSATDDDLNGHGTHCSGTMAGSSYGIAKSANLIAVKVLGDLGSGSTSDVISGVNYVADRHRITGGPSVANMSLGGGASTALDNAVNSAVSAGVHVAVAAGNDNANACNYSPARAASAVCVGATDKNDRKSSFSNYGNCVEIHAPGTDITSAWINNDSASRTISGTSMASPHVAGVMALYLSRGKNPTAAALQNASTKNAITGLPTGTVNYLLYSDDLL